MDTSYGGIRTPHGFYFGRHQIDLGVGDLITGLIEYRNVPPLIASVLSTGMTTLHELDTVYGVEDIFDMLEVSTVNSYNRRIVQKHAHSN